MEDLKITDIEESANATFVYYIYTRKYGEEKRIFEATSSFPQVVYTKSGKRRHMKRAELLEAIKNKLNSEIIGSS